MGRYLAAAIPTRIAIRNRNDFRARKEVNTLKDKDLILNKLTDYIDANFYNISYEEEILYLEINKDKTNKYLKEFLKEISLVLDLNSYLFYDLFGESEVVEKADIEEKLNVISLKSNKDGKYYLTGDNLDKSVAEDWACLNGAPWAFDLDEKFYGSLDLHIEAINIWIEFDKFVCEDETKMLRLLNKCAKVYFKSELSKIMMFHITE